jgi:hypothetical protein
VENPVPKADGKLIVAEEIQEGHVSAAAGSLSLRLFDLYNPHILNIQ